MDIEYLIVDHICFVVDPVRAIIDLTPYRGKTPDSPQEMLKEMHECKFW